MLRWSLAALGACFTLLAGGLLAQSSESIPGVENPQRAWQNWALNCQGCHRPDGTGSAETTPALLGTTAKFLRVPAGREYLSRVPGVATSALSDRDLAEELNWMLWRFDRDNIPKDFTPYTPDEVKALRARPLRVEASKMRSELLAQAETRGKP